MYSLLDCVHLEIWSHFSTFQIFNNIVLRWLEMGFSDYSILVTIGFYLDRSKGHRYLLE